MESGNLGDLKFEEGEHVINEKDVAHLFPLPAKISQGKPEPMCDSPPHDPALIDFTELTNAGNDSKPIDDDGQIIGVRILLTSGISDELA